MTLFRPGKEGNIRICILLSSNLTVQLPIDSIKASSEHIDSNYNHCHYLYSYVIPTNICFKAAAPKKIILPTSCVGGYRRCSARSAAAPRRPAAGARTRRGGRPAGTSSSPPPAPGSAASASPWTACRPGQLSAEHYMLDMISCSLFIRNEMGQRSPWQCSFSESLIHNHSC